MAGVSSVNNAPSRGFVFYSINPKSVNSWASAVTALTHGIEGISYANGTFVAGGHIENSPTTAQAGIAASVSGKTWSLETSPLTNLDSFCDYASDYSTDFNEIIVPIHNAGAGLLEFKFKVRFPVPDNPNPQWPFTPGASDEPVIGMDSTQSITEVRRNPDFLHILQARPFGGGNWQDVFISEDNTSVLKGLVWGPLRISAVQFLKGTDGPPEGGGEV